MLYSCIMAMRTACVLRFHQITWQKLVFVVFGNKFVPLPFWFTNHVLFLDLSDRQRKIGISIFVEIYFQCFNFIFVYLAQIFSLKCHKDYYSYQLPNKLAITWEQQKWCMGDYKSSHWSLSIYVKRVDTLMRPKSLYASFWTHFWFNTRAGMKLKQIAKNSQMPHNAKSVVFFRICHWTANWLHLGVQTTIWVFWNKEMPLLQI